MKDITTIGIDIAKNNMQLHGIDDTGRVILKKRLTRAKFLPFMANLPNCTIGMEACGGAHYWAGELTQLGFITKLMHPRTVKKFVDNHKNDAKDAAACAEAVNRQSTNFIPIKNKTQISIQAHHRVRSYYVAQRTALMNMTRGLLLEMGIAIPKGKAAFMEQLLLLLQEENEQLSTADKPLFQSLYNSLIALNKEVKKHNETLEKLAEQDENCKRLCTLPGVGPITATGIIAKIGNGSEFKKGRDLSAYLGLVPKQHSSGDKHMLLGISKHGDRYIRQLLIHGGRSSLKAALRKDKITLEYQKQDVHSQWMRKLSERVGINKASVAIANKNARMMIALLKSSTTFQGDLAH